MPHTESVNHSLPDGFQILSYSKRYKAHGRAGWTLPDGTSEPEKSEAADTPNPTKADVYGFEAVQPGEARVGGGT